jgi:hypothetical protein
MFDFSLDRRIAIGSTFAATVAPQPRGALPRGNAARSELRQRTAIRSYCKL